MRQKITPSPHGEDRSNGCGTAIGTPVRPRERDGSPERTGCIVNQQISQRAVRKPRRLRREDVTALTAETDSRTDTSTEHGGACESPGTTTIPSAFSQTRFGNDAGNYNPSGSATSRFAVDRFDVSFVSTRICSSDDDDTTSLL